ncbi:MAG: cell division protein FtsX [Hyphomonadaceae bacterium]
MSSSRSPLLPKEDAREAALFFVVGALCFLAALAGLAARSAYSAADTWTSAVTGQVTVRVRGDDDAARRAVNILKSQPEVADARALSREERETLLKPWMGAAGVPADLPLPNLVAADLRVQSDDIGPRLNHALTSAGLDVTVDDHVVWSRGVRRTTDSAGAVALGAVILLLATAVAVIAFATHATLLARRDIVELLHLSGARDSFISGLFEQRFLMLGVQAGTVGALAAFVAAALTLFALKQSGGDGVWLLPELSLSLADGLILGLTPLAAGLAAMLAAKVTVWRSLADTV